jgi:hypothetical protein
MAACSSVHEMPAMTRVVSAIDRLDVLQCFRSVESSSSSRFCWLKFTRSTLITW